MSKSNGNKLDSVLFYFLLPFFNEKLKIKKIIDECDDLDYLFPGRFKLKCLNIEENCQIYYTYMEFSGQNC